MRRAHQKQSPATWAVLIAVMLALTVGCALGSTAWYQAVVSAKAAAASDLPFAVVERMDVSADYTLADGILSVEKGLDANGRPVAWLVTAVTKGAQEGGTVTVTAVVSADGKTLGGITDVKFTSVGSSDRYANIRATLPYYTDRYQNRYLPFDGNGIAAAAGAVEASQAVADNVTFSTAFVRKSVIG